MLPKFPDIRARGGATLIVLAYASLVYSVAAILRGGQSLKNSQIITELSSPAIRTYPKSNVTSPIRWNITVSGHSKRSSYRF